MYTYTQRIFNPEYAQKTIYRMKWHKTLKTLAYQQPFVGSNCTIEQQIAKNMCRASQLKSKQHINCMNYHICGCRDTKTLTVDVSGHCYFFIVVFNFLLYYLNLEFCFTFPISRNQAAFKQRYKDVC